jgi:hypothetical protein
MEFYSVTKNNEIILLAGKWVELETIVIKEINQSHKDNYCMYLPFVKVMGKKLNMIMKVKKYY